MAASDDLGVLCDRLTMAMEAVNPALAVAAAQFLATRALIELLDERGILPIADVRERALEIAVGEAAPADVIGKLDQLLPDPGAVPPTATAHRPH